MDSLCRAGSLTILPEVNPEIINLDSINCICQGWTKLNERAAAKKVPHAGSQSIEHCN